MIFANPNDLNSYLEAFAQKEKERIELAKKDRVFRILGERNPYTLVSNFIAGMDSVLEVYNSTSNTLRRADELRRNETSKWVTLIILGGGFIVFVFGIVLPLISFQLKAYYYIHLPLAYYTIVYIMLIYKIMNILAV